MVLRIEYDKARGGAGQQAGVYQGQGNYAAPQAQVQDNYSGYGQQQQGAGAAAGGQAAAGANPGAAPAEGSAEAWEQYRAYWAAYGYDVNDPQFQEWQASQMQQGAGQ